MHVQNKFCKEIGSKRPFQPSAVVRAIYRRLWGCHRQLDDQYRNPNINNRDHLVGQLTTTFGTCSLNPVWAIIRLLKAMIVRNKGKVQKNMQHEFFLLPSRFFSTFPFVKIFHSPNLSKHPPAAIVSLFNKADQWKGFWVASTCTFHVRNYTNSQTNVWNYLYS